MSNNYTVGKTGPGQHEATIRDVRASGDSVHLKRQGNDVTATYLPPPGLTANLPGVPESIPLAEVRDLIQKFPEIAIRNGFALAIELSLYDAAEARKEAAAADPMAGLLAMIGGLKGSNGRLDEQRVNDFADRAKAMGLYK